MNDGRASARAPRMPRAPDDHQHRRLEQWQYEVTGGSRIWYVINEEKMTIFVVAAGTGHPKATDPPVPK
jgi:hypothetical protein